MEQTIDRDLQRGELRILIRDMEVGDILRFPLKIYPNVCSVAYNRLHVERAEGCRWTVNADLAAKQAVVSRIS